MSLHYISPDIDICQGELVDYNVESERFVDWRSKKVYSEMVADSFKRLGEHKTSTTIRFCGTDLVFKEFTTGEKKLHKANFCRHRLCPMCAWRKSLKKFSQVSQMMGYLDQFNYNYIFITLTVRNCPGNELSSWIDKMLDAYHELYKDKEIKKAFLGGFRALEITYNYERHDYHPHIHIIVPVRKSYFTGRDYIKYADFRQKWIDLLHLDYTPKVDMRKIEDENGNLARSVAEVAKYTVKGSSYIYPEDIYEQDKVISVLSETLRGRRLTSVRGVFRDAQRALNIDLEDADLTHTDLETEMDKRLDYVLMHYKWSFCDGRYMCEGEVTDFDVD